jgi:hypothetical protein
MEKISKLKTSSAARLSLAPLKTFPITSVFCHWQVLALLARLAKTPSTFATSRLNRLYVELLKDNPEWGTTERRHDMNKFMARLIFCFAEDTDIFIGKGRFTDTIAQMSERDASNMHDVIATLFRAMNTPNDERPHRYSTLGCRISLC